jgi:predicted DNA binding CopG/RHH family protein
MMDDDKVFNVELDEEERELLESYESGEWVPVPNLEAEIARHRSYAEASARKDRRVNIRLSRMDLTALQNLAVEEGIPYQTLMASILHKYVTGRLVERPRMTVAELALLEERESYKT